MGEEISVFFKLFILALGSTQPLLCTVVSAREYSSRGVKSTTHVPVVPKLRISGAISLLPLYVCLQYGGQELFFTFYLSNTSETLPPGPIGTVGKFSGLHVFTTVSVQCI